MPIVFRVALVLEELLNVVDGVDDRRVDSRAVVAGTAVDEVVGAAVDRVIPVSPLERIRTGTADDYVCIRI
jgi:hypothetical protein